MKKRDNVLPDGRATSQTANTTIKAQRLRVPLEAIVIPILSIKYQHNKVVGFVTKLFLF
jgi:hypothetical protein